MICNRLSLAVVVAMMVGFIGCTKSDSADSASEKSGGAQGSAIEREAQEFAAAQVQKHWTKSADGWTTARTSGSAYAPEHFLRQMRELAALGAVSIDLNESDKLNGMEWAGEVFYKKAPCREAGDSGLVLENIGDVVNVNRPHGQWSQWIDFKPDSLRVQKVKGKWQCNEDQWLLRGAIPTPQDYANAGVK